MWGFHLLSHWPLAFLSVSLFGLNLLAQISSPFEVGPYDDPCKSTVTAQLPSDLTSHMYRPAPHVTDESTVSRSPYRINVIDQPRLSTRHCTMKSSLSDLSVGSKCPWQSFCLSTALAAASSCENQVTSHDAVTIAEKSRKYSLRSGAEPAV